MKTVRLYWSNICILHRFEKEFLDHLHDELLKQDINLEVTYFGLGAPMYLNTYFMQENFVYPDIMVSTDLEVFENEKIYTPMKQHLLPLTKFYDIKKEIQSTSIYRDAYLLPYLVIPLVFSYNERCNSPTSIQEMLQQQQETTIGGIHNSGAKCIIKAIWSYFGKEAAIQFLNTTTLQNMPIQAFHEVRMGSNKLAITPLVYAKRADNTNLFVSYPSDGAIALPSYITCFKTLDANTREIVLDALLSPSFVNSFVENASMYACICNTLDDGYIKENKCKFMYPSKEFFQETTSDEFYEVYNQYI